MTDRNVQGSGLEGCCRADCLFSCHMAAASLLLVRMTTGILKTGARVEVCFASFVAVAALLLGAKCPEADQDFDALKEEDRL